MKKFFLLIGLVVLVSGSVFSDDWDDLMRSIGYYDGDPNQTQILEANKDYVVIRNLTARANLEYDSS